MSQKLSTGKTACYIHYNEISYCFFNSSCKVSQELTHSKMPEEIVDQQAQLFEVMDNHLNELSA